MRTMNELYALLNVCEKFIDEHDIHGEENVYQSDNVILNAYEFIDEVCKIVGYKKYKEDEE